MEHDDRDRRDSPDAEAADDASPTPTDPIQPDEPVAPAPAEPAEADAPPAPADADAPAAEIESWTAQEAVAQTPDSSDTQAWPTEPPSAGSGDADTWPTEPPERGEAPILEPEPEPEPAGAWSASEPPPPEVEAYPAPVAPLAEAQADVDAAPVAAAHAVPAAESATGESTQCPRCGTENRPGLAFCRNCGQRLVAAGVASTLERPGTPEGTTACPRCGTHNRSGVAFCQNCGANLRGTAPGYVPPAAVAEPGSETVVAERRGAILGPAVLLIGLIGLATGYLLLPFAYGAGSLAERAIGSDGYGLAFWSGYPATAALQDQAYFGLAAPVPALGLILLALGVAGFVRAVPGSRQTIGLVVALLWSVGLIILFVVVELAGNWSGDLVGMLRVLTPAGIIFFLASLIVLIGALTRFGRS